MTGDGMPAPSSPTPALSKPVVPATINSGCPELDQVWHAYARRVVASHIPIPDTEDDLNWHAFLGHSADMQGFRAAEFAGVDPLTRPAPSFVPLNRRGLGIPQLAALWDIPQIQHHLRVLDPQAPLDLPALRLLASAGGHSGHSLAEAFEGFPWPKFNRSVRALLENSAKLGRHAHSFRQWLREECRMLGVTEFPPPRFRRAVVLQGKRMALEQALRRRLDEEFYMVGPALAAYMICDWQLWLWLEGRTQVFGTFKLDRFHERFVRAYGRERIPVDEAGFARWWHGLFPDLPPRLANECIWLGVEHRLVVP